MKEECEYKNNSNTCITCTLPMFIVQSQHMFKFETLNNDKSPEVLIKITKLQKDKWEIKKNWKYRL